MCLNCFLASYWVISSTCIARWRILKGLDDFQPSVARNQVWGQIRTEVFVFDSSLRPYLNHIEARVYLYLYLIENSVFVFEFLGKSVFDPGPASNAVRYQTMLMPSTAIMPGQPGGSLLSRPNDFSAEYHKQQRYCVPLNHANCNGD